MQNHARVFFAYFIMDRTSLRVEDKFAPSDGLMFEIYGPSMSVLRIY